MTSPAKTPSPGERPPPTKPGRNGGMGEADRLEQERRAKQAERAAQRTESIPEGQRRAFIIAMVVAVLASSAGDTILKRGMLDLHSPSTGAFLGDGLKLISDIFIDVGAALMIVHFIAFIRALRLGPLSAAVPLRSSSYVLTTILAKYWLGEDVNAERWIAIFLILFGVSIIGRSTENGSESDRETRRQIVRSAGQSPGKGPAAGTGL